MLDKIGRKPTCLVNSSLRLLDHGRCRLCKMRTAIQQQLLEENTFLSTPQWTRERGDEEMVSCWDGWSAVISCFCKMGKQIRSYAL